MKASLILATGSFVLFGLFVNISEAQDGTGPVELRNARAAYQQQIKAATEPIKLRYAQTLESLKKALGARGDVQGALAVQMELDALGLPQRVPLGSRENAKLIVWNQNNGGKGDRGTRKINVAFRSGNKETWRVNGFRMQWDKTKQDKEIISVPSVAVDVIRIEVTELINDAGGLAEVEYIKDGKNVALGCTVSASGVWQNNAARFGSPNLTDGNPNSFWLLPDKQTGWVEINLREQK